MTTWNSIAVPESTERVISSPLEKAMQCRTLGPNFLLKSTKKSTRSQTNHLKASEKFGWNRPETREKRSIRIPSSRTMKISRKSYRVRQLPSSVSSMKRELSLSRKRMSSQKKGVASEEKWIKLLQDSMKSLRLRIEKGKRLQILSLS